ncbi:putative serine/threonine-protein kinase [Sesbania bispinosa]|nr:putative serine/threonine-protein kinase [Sesbania bispinosa]
MEIKTRHLGATATLSLYRVILVQPPPITAATTSDTRDMLPLPRHPRPAATHPDPAHVCVPAASLPRSSCGCVVPAHASSEGREERTRRLGVVV